ncbi:MAG: hypothetical protein B0D92_04970 [Spirochaeta sp. LUC14_002_19_P3]|nr:MAG: hypothetical protein B0D92_04970 [Spirochaeta sp. LUC14_002_19_P3]
MNCREDVFPAAFLTRDKNVLIVGGGKTAAAKLERLILFSWRLTVLSLEFHPKIMRLAEQGRVKIITGCYQPGILDDFQLVFAIVNASEVNSKILLDAKRLGIPACAADKNWCRGTFITPAIIRSCHGIAAFSSGGISRRITRLMKNSLKRQIEATEDWTPVVLGSSRQQIGGDRLEKLCRNANATKRGKLLLELRGVHEFMLFSGSGRVEFYGLVSAGKMNLELIRIILGFDKMTPDEVYLYFGIDALRHLSQAGLCSRNPEEKGLADQLKFSFNEAQKKGWAGPFMKSWLETAENPDSTRENYEKLML